MKTSGVLGDRPSLVLLAPFNSRADKTAATLVCLSSSAKMQIGDTPMAMRRDVTALVISIFGCGHTRQR